MATRVSDVSSDEAGFNPSSSYACANSFNLSAGNDVLVHVRWESNPSASVSSVTDTAGNTYAAIASTLAANGDIQSQWWLCENAATGHATNIVTANFSSSNPYFKGIAALQYSGLADTPTDAVATGTSISAVEVISGSFTTTVADTVILTAVGQSSSFGDAWTWTPGTYTTIEESLGAGNGGYIVIAERVVSAIQTGVTVRGDTATTNNKRISVVALDATAGAAGGWLLVAN